MKVFNLLFSAPMVRAIIREIEQPGTGKTQTRRATEPCRDKEMKAGDILVSWPADAFIRQAARFRPRFKTGDLIYVREAWRVSKRWEGIKPSDLPPRIMSVFFEAGGSISGVHDLPSDKKRPLADYVPDLCYPPCMPNWAGKRRPGMFLPRWASRLTLEVTDVRIERLQEISEADAVAEGAWLWRDDNDPGGIIDDCRDAFCHLWDSINGDRPGLAWKYNPWVVAISFRPHLINIDAYLERSAS